MVILERERGNDSYRKIARKYKISKTSAHRIVDNKEEFFNPEPEPIKKKRGRRKKLSDRDIRKLERSLKRLRKQKVNITVMDVVKDAGFVGNEVHRRTFSSYLNNLGYKFMNARKKGLLTEKDKEKRLRYARKMLVTLKSESNFYKEHISFYLDAVSFVHKYNPLQEAQQPKSRIWRKAGEGLEFTAKGSKDLPGGRRVHLLVAIAYGKGVIFVEEYEKMNGTYFANFIQRNMNIIFAKAGPKFNGQRLFLMDNDPSQNSVKASAEIYKIEGEIHAIPPRSPDLNPIENIFKIAKERLEVQAIAGKIEKETLHEFTMRIRGVMEQIDCDLIDKTIDSMPQRLKAVIKNHGNRTKY